MGLVDFKMVMGDYICSHVVLQYLSGEVDRFNCSKFDVFIVTYVRLRI